MAEVVTPTSEPNYILSLALQAAPFSATLETGAFFADGQSGHRLNLLLHLFHSNDKIASLVAGNGFGKTTLLKQLASHVGDEIKLCQLDAKQHHDSTVILEKCLVDLGVDNSEIAGAIQPTEILRNRLQQLQKLNIKVVLVFDNADEISSSALADMAEWFSWQTDGQFLLSAVFASSQPLGLAGDAKSRLQEIDLPKMEEKEVGDYLLHRLQAVGFKQELPFSQQDIKRITLLSSGRAAEVNRLAHQHLMGLKLTGQTSLVRNVLQGLSRWAGFAIIILSVVALISFQDTITTWFKSTDSSEVKQEVIKLEEQQFAKVETESIQNHEADSERQELESLLAELDEDKLAEPKVGAEPLLANQQQQPPPATRPDNEVHGISWIKQQPATNYTFQLMGSWEKKEIDAFIDNYALSGDVAVFESLRNGRIWYALIYGSYIDKQTALTTSQQWPAPLNTLPSWLRRFDSVQNQIKNKAVTGQ